MHFHESDARGALPAGDGKLMLAAGADIDLPGDWKSRFEWQRYSNVDRGDRSIFSVRFEYKF
jgi:hypothetical protein